MSPSGMKILNVLFTLHHLLGQPEAGTACLAQFACVSRATIKREMLKAERAGLVDICEIPYRKSFARRFRLSEAGILMMSIPF